MRTMPLRLLKWLLSKIVLAPRHRAYLCLSYEMLAISHQERIFVSYLKELGFGTTTSGLAGFIWGHLAVQPARLASLGRQSASSWRGENSSSNLCLDYKKWGRWTMHPRLQCTRSPKTVLSPKRRAYLFLSGIMLCLSHQE